MNSIKINDTIAAIATGLGDCGIGIVRISGPRAMSVADKIFKSKDGKKPSEYKTYTVHYGWIIDPSSVTNDGIIDEVLLTVMRAPRSYTREDIVEINCHGGIVAMRRVLDVVLENGCRLGNPGEFTMRAFLNGRIDLAQAEAVIDIIRAKTDSALKMASAQLEGRLSRSINNIRGGLLDVLSSLEAGIDFPEEELGKIEAEKLGRKLLGAKDGLRNMLASARQGRILREGIRAVICGLPNVGKSSLLNALLKKERCIVTSIAGTTRDAIEETIDIKGVPVRIMDTAGIIEPRDLVEKKAVASARKYIDDADLVLLVFDGSRKLSGEDHKLMRALKKRRVLAVINKSDLKPGIEREKVLRDFRHCVSISAKKFSQIERLEKAIEDLAFGSGISAGEPAMVAAFRHIRCLRQAEKFIAGALCSMDNGLSAELIAQDLKDALIKLDEILGKNFSAQLLDKIFGDFCIGK